MLLRNLNTENILTKEWSLWKVFLKQKVYETSKIFMMCQCRVNWSESEILFSWDCIFVPYINRRKSPWISLTQLKSPGGVSILLRFVRELGSNFCRFGSREVVTMSSNWIIVHSHIVMFVTSFRQFILKSLFRIHLLFL